MAIYGVNFGAPTIPQTPRTAFRKFKPRMRVDGVMYSLVGIGQTTKERDYMLVVANNGHRKLHVHPVATAGGTWFGIYAY